MQTVYGGALWQGVCAHHRVSCTAGAMDGERPRAPLGQPEASGVGSGSSCAFGGHQSHFHVPILWRRLFRRPVVTRLPLGGSARFAALFWDYSLHNLVAAGGG